VAIGIARDVVLLVQHRQQLVDDDTRVLVVERVVFGGTVRRAVAPFGWRRFRLVQVCGRD
jgi:hypothetical protein